MLARSLAKTLESWWHRGIGRQGCPSRRWLPRHVNLGGLHDTGHPAPLQGLLHQRTGKVNRSQNYFPPSDFFFSFAKVLEEFCTSSGKGREKVHEAKAGFAGHGAPSGKGLIWWQDCRGRDAPLVPTDLFVSGDREVRGPSVCVPHGEGTVGTWQLPTLPLLVGCSGPPRRCWHEGPRDVPPHVYQYTCSPLQALLLIILLHLWVQGLHFFHGWWQGCG